MTNPHRHRGGLAAVLALPLLCCAGHALLLALGTSLIVDEGLTPALGLSAPNRAYPLAAHVRGVLAHLVFGLAVAAATETAWTLLGRRP